MKLSIIVPCFNEALNLPHIYEKFLNLTKQHNNLEIVLVNNGSTDESAIVFDYLLSKDTSNCFTLVNIKKNKGYGFGILSGLKKASGDVLSWTHADLQTDPSDVLTAFELFSKHNQKIEIFIKGKRKLRPFLDTFFTWGMGILSSLALGIRLDDINAQPKLFSRNFYESYVQEKAPFDFSLDLFILYQAHNYCDSIIEIPVYFKNRQFGEAKGGGGSWKNRIRLIKRTITYIFELKNSLIKK